MDLASKFSAAVLRDSTGQVLWQGDSANLSAFRWADTIARIAHGIREKAEELHVLIEDVPYGISSQAMTKPVLRLQGMIIYALGDMEFYFINPSTWQKEYEGVARSPKGMSKADGAKARIEAARVAAENLGYTPPNLVQAYVESLPEGTKVLKKHTNPLSKNMTDYVDAFLMNDWLMRHEHEYKTLTGVQPPVI